MKKIFIFIICIFSIFSFAEEDIGKIRDMIAIVNPAEKRLAKAIKDASEKSGIPSEVLVAKFTNESGFGEKLDNSLGYVGIGQMGAAAFETGLRLEVKGQEYALNFLLEVMKEKEKISLRMMREFNSLVMVNGGGIFKKVPNEMIKDDNIDLDNLERDTI